MENKFRIPRIYLPPTGGPLYWRNEETGVLPAAVKAFIDKTQTDEQLNLMREYLEYYIHAPCWDFADALKDELTELRSSSKTMRTEAEIFDWLFKALDIGIDPI